MPLDQHAYLLEAVGGRRLRDDEVGVEALRERARRVEDEGVPAGHAGTEVQPGLTEHDDGPVRHVLAAVVADTFDHGDGARVADGEALSGRTRAEELASGRAVERGVPDEARLARIVERRFDDDASAAHRLADVVVGLSDEVKLDARGQERAEALPGRALEVGTQAPRGRHRAVALGYCPAKSRADRAVAVRDHVPRLDERRPLERRGALRVDELSEAVTGPAGR